MKLKFRTPKQLKFATIGDNPRMMLTALYTSLVAKRIFGK
jgi:hypothetical protein